MKINITFDTGTTNEAFKNCVYAARDFLCARFVGGGQFNLQAGLGTLAGSPFSGLGGSTFFLQVGTFTYSQIRTAVQNKALTANAIAAFNASWPVSSPNAGNMDVTNAEAKSLGLLAVDNSIDGFFALGSGHTFDYTPDNTTTPPGGSFKAFSVIVHEITENMGRILGSDAPPSDFVPSSMYSYSAPGVRAWVATATHQFSIDAGTTLLRPWNTNFPVGDAGDWLNTGDCASAFTSAGILAPWDATDDLQMEVIGYGFIPNANPGNVAVSGSGKGRGGF